MTDEELQQVVDAVLQALKTNGKTINQMTPVTELADGDNFEVSEGRRINFANLAQNMNTKIERSPLGTYIGPDTPAAGTVLWLDTDEGGVTPIAQTTGQSTTSVMSQKAVTDALKKPIVEKSDASVTLSGEQVCDLGIRTSAFSVSLPAGAADNVEYEFLFSSGATPPTISFPQGIDLGGFSPKANKSYDCIIYNSKLYYYEW